MKISQLFSFLTNSSEEMEGGEETARLLQKGEGEELGLGLVRRVWEESKKLWVIVGPAVVGRLALYGMCVISQAYAGHLSDLELASFSIATNVFVALNFGLMLGMASAMETLCGQAYGAKKYHMMGVYMQRSWIILFLCAVLILPLYFFATPFLKFTGQTEDLARQAGQLCLWFIPMHLSFVLLFPLQRFLQCQLKNSINAFFTVVGLVVHIFISWLFVEKLKLGLIATALTLDFSWWVTVLGMLGYCVFGGCPDTWKGFSLQAFTELWDFLRLSAASGVMLCLEYWYYRILLILAGNMKNAKIAVDALSVCMNINGWEIMIPMAFFAGTGVRVANELGAGNGKGARFAAIVSVANSLIIGILFWFVIIYFHDNIAFIFSSSKVVLDAVDKLFIPLAFTILLNSIQPILSGVAVGSGWQPLVAYVNIGTYYLIGVPAGVLLGWTFDLGVLGIWVGMIGGTIVQTLILAFITIRRDWDKEAMIANVRMQKWSTDGYQNVEA